MLLEFRFKNYKSFKEETILDMTATKQSELNYHVVEMSNEKILPVASIFGANASGKSNVFEAYNYMVQYVYNSFGYGDAGFNTNDPENFTPPSTYAFDKKTLHGETYFEVFFTNQFVNDDKIYNYGFTVDHKGINSEWLYSKAKTERKNFKKIFEREKDYIDLVGIKGSQRDNLLTSLRKQTLIISLGSKLNIGVCDAVAKWFLYNLCINFAETNVMDDFDYFARNYLASHTEEHNNVVKYINTFDESIIGLKTKYVESSNGSKIPIVTTIHKMNDSNDVIEFNLEQESCGTKKMIMLYNWFNLIMKTGGVLFIDELNARLHPLLVRNIIQKFTDPEKNINHAQLIFTTHDAWQLDNGSLRRDEIWFTEKSKTGETELFSLADFKDDDGLKIRKEENYERNYMLGKYGAIPELKSFYYNMGGKK